MTFRGKMCSSIMLAALVARSGGSSGPNTYATPVPGHRSDKAIRTTNKVNLCDVVPITAVEAFFLPFYGPVIPTCTGGADGKSAPPANSRTWSSGDARLDVWVIAAYGDDQSTCSGRKEPVQVGAYLGDVESSFLQVCDGDFAIQFHSSHHTDAITQEIAFAADQAGPVAAAFQTALG